MFDKDHMLLPDNLQGRSITTKVIPTVCNLKNMLRKLVSVHGDFEQLKQWEKRSYTAYLVEEVKSNILCSSENEWSSIIKNHILSKRPSELGASAIDIYLVAYVAETFGPGKSILFKYVKDSEISKEGNTAQAIWQVGKGDGVFLGILNDDGSVKDWNYIKKWAGVI